MRDMFQNIFLPKHFREAEYNAGDIFPLCRFGRKSNNQYCQSTIKPISTPLGKCLTINSNSEFGKVRRVGEKQGLEIAIDVKNFQRLKKRFADDDLGGIRVCKNIWNFQHSAGA